MKRKGSATKDDESAEGGSGKRILAGSADDRIATPGFIEVAYKDAIDSNQPSAEVLVDPDSCISLLTATGDIQCEYRAGGDIYIIESNIWSDLPLMPFGRSLAVGGLLSRQLRHENGSIEYRPTFVVCGGTRFNPRGRGELYLKTVSAFSKGDAAWSTLRAMPGDGRCGHGSVAAYTNEDGIIVSCPGPMPHNNTLYVLGGITSKMTGTKDLYRYSSYTNKWDILAEMNYRQINCSPVILGNKLIVLGPNATNSQCTFESYDSERDEWTAFEFPTPLERYHFKAAACDHRKSIFCIGGILNGRITESGDIVNIETQQLQTMSDMPVALHGHSICTNSANPFLLYVVGGRTNSPIDPITGLRDHSVHRTKVVLRYDTRSDEWAKVCDMPVGNTENTVIACGYW